MEFKLDISGLDALKNASNEELDKIDMGAIGALITASVKSEFDASQDPFGNPWAALKRPRPKSRNQNNKPLLDSGKLKNSFSYRVLSVNSVEIGTGVSYAPYHQRGTSKMPARKMLPETSMPQAWDNIITAYFKSLK